MDEVSNCHSEREQAILIRVHSFHEKGAKKLPKRLQGVVLLNLGLEGAEDGHMSTWIT